MNDYKLEAALNSYYNNYEWVVYLFIKGTLQVNQTACKLLWVEKKNSYKTTDFFIEAKIT